MCSNNSEINNGKKGYSEKYTSTGGFNKNIKLTNVLKKKKNTSNNIPYTHHQIDIKTRTPTVFDVIIVALIVNLIGVIFLCIVGIIVWNSIPSLRMFFEILKSASVAETIIQAILNKTQNTYVSNSSS